MDESGQIAPKPYYAIWARAGQSYVALGTASVTWSALTAASRLLRVPAAKTHQRCQVASRHHHPVRPVVSLSVRRQVHDAGCCSRMPAHCDDRISAGSPGVWGRAARSKQKNVAVVRALQFDPQIPDRRCSVRTIGMDRFGTRVATHFIRTFNELVSGTTPLPACPSLCTLRPRQRGIEWSASSRRRSKRERDPCVGPNPSGSCCRQEQALDRPSQPVVHCRPRRSPADACPVRR